MKHSTKTLQRMCVGCREMKEKRELIRIVRSPEGDVFIDETGKKSGRGAYLCNDKNCFDKAVKTNALSKALSCNISTDLINSLREQFE